MRNFDLPPVIKQLVEARQSLKMHYDRVLERQGSDAELRFTFDGNLVGDIGEAIAAHLFGIELVKTKSNQGFDGYSPGTRKTVQVKATGTGRGPAFRPVKRGADFLLFFDLDLECGTGAIVFNGPEHYARRKLRPNMDSQRSLTPKKIREANEEVKETERLVRLN